MSVYDDKMLEKELERSRSSSNYAIMPLEMETYTHNGIHSKSLPNSGYIENVCIICDNIADIKHCNINISNGVHIIHNISVEINIMLSSLIGLETTDTTMPLFWFSTVKSPVPDTYIKINTNREWRLQYNHCSYVENKNVLHRELKYYRYYVNYDIVIRKNVNFIIFKPHLQQELEPMVTINNNIVVDMFNMDVDNTVYYIVSLVPEVYDSDSFRYYLTDIPITDVNNTEQNSLTVTNHAGKPLECSLDIYMLGVDEYKDAFEDEFRDDE